MLSSKVQEIKESAQDVANDIAARAKATVSDISAETKDTQEKSDEHPPPDPAQAR